MVLQRGRERVDLALRQPVQDWQIRDALDLVGGEIERAMDVIGEAGKKLGIIK